MHNREPHGLKRWASAIALCVVLVVAAVLRLRGLGAQSFWYDESLTLESVTQPITQVSASVERWENTPPLYFLLLDLWAKVFGTSEVSLRLPSALCGVAAVGAIYLLGKALAGSDKHRDEWIGIAAATLLAVSRYHIAYSQEARAYALMFLLACLSCCTMAVLLRGRARWAQVGYVLASAAMLWTHPMSAFVLVAQAVFIAGRAAGGWMGDGLGLRGWVMLMGAVVVLFGPWVSRALLVASAGQPWMPMPRLGVTLREYVTPWPVMTALLLLAGIGLVCGRCKREGGPVFAWMLMIGCVVLPIALSHGRHPIFTPRYGIAGLIGLYLGAAYGAAVIGRRWGIVALCLACAPTVPGLVADFRSGLDVQRKADVRSAAGKVMELAQPGDVAWCPAEFLRRPLRIYLRRPGLVVLDQVEAAPERRRIWLVCAAAEMRGLTGESKYGVEREFEFSGVSVYELQAVPTTRAATGNLGAQPP